MIGLSSVINFFIADDTVPLVISSISNEKYFYIDTLLNLPEVMRMYSYTIFIALLIGG